jgi:hypothetical protein
MTRKSTILALVVLVGLAGGCAKQEPGADPAVAAWDALVAAWGEAETAEEKSVLAENYLADFPDTEHSGSMAGAVIYYRGHEMEDPQGAYDVVSAALEMIEDPEQRFDVSMELLSLSDSVDVPLDVAQVADDLGGVRALTYGEHQQVAETATALEQWSVAGEHSSMAVELATPEGYQADYPDREFTDEDLLERAQRRKALSLAYDGWALYNLGATDAAFTRFAESEEAGSVTYLGTPSTPLNIFWGRAALNEGDHEAAVRLLGLETLFGEDPAGAKPYLREAYVAKNGDEEGFDEFLWATRNELATPVDDFELLDYEGNAHRLSDASGKVTLLAFWFPT